jgi:hypothetical protein
MPPFLILVHPVLIGGNGGIRKSQNWACRVQQYAATVQIVLISAQVLMAKANMKYARNINHYGHLCYSI